MVDHGVMCTKNNCFAQGPTFPQYAEFPNDQPYRAVLSWNKRNG